MVLNRGTSTYFNNYHASREQQLLEDLMIESIKIYGQDMLYLPRDIISFDPLYTSDDQSSYTKAIPIEMYIKSVDGFEGDGAFLSKFGLEIRDQVTLTVARRIFNEEVKAVTDQERPNEGDLIYFPLNKKLFQIKYVNYKPFFYQLGTLITYDLVCEVFEYSSQVINTGYKDIDTIEAQFSLNVLDYAILSEDKTTFITDESGNIITNEQFLRQNIAVTGQNEVIQKEQSSGTQIDQQVVSPTIPTGIINFTEIDPFSEGTY